tara:strand:+ start:310 stop:669 length:360 start_codon:yes stop_codon:yes gene_type:complete
MIKKEVNNMENGIWSEFAEEGLNSIKVEKDSLKDIFQEPFECIRYKHSGNMYEGYVDEVFDDYIKARVCLLDKYDLKIGEWFTVILYKQVFKGIELEWWYEGQGSCSRGSGCWERLEVA